MSDRVARAAGSVLIAVATAVVIVNAAILPFLSSPWIAFAQDRAEVVAWTGYERSDVRLASDAMVADLVRGGSFDVAVDGEPVLTDAERAHMHDVRRVLVAAWVVGGLGALALVVGGAVARRAAWFWGGVRAGAVVVATAVVVLGAAALVAFETGFELFHRLFFAAGNYAFDPSTDRLVQLFPIRLWLETTLALGAVILLLAVATALVAARRLRPRPAGGRVVTARLEHAQ